MKDHEPRAGKSLQKTRICTAGVGAIAMSRPRKCRICKKRPVWRGGDVKSPGPFREQCYHKEGLALERNATSKTAGRPAHRAAETRTI